MKYKFAYLGVNQETKNIDFTTLDHGFFIKELCKMTNCQKYLELGVDQNKTFKIISEIVPYCVGVDMSDRRITKNGIFHQKSTDDFFKDNTDIFDIIFIDASHKIENVLKDFKNSLSCLSEYGIILLHDTDPAVKTLYNKNGDFCGDAADIVEIIEKEYEDLNIITLPFDSAGLSIVNRKKDKRLKKII